MLSATSSADCSAGSVRRRLLYDAAYLLVSNNCASTSLFGINLATSQLTSRASTSGLPR